MVGYSGKHHRSIVPEGTAFLAHQYCTMQDPGLGKEIDVIFPQQPTRNLPALQKLLSKEKVSESFCD